MVIGLRRLSLNSDRHVIVHTLTTLYMVGDVHKKNEVSLLLVGSPVPRCVRSNLKHKDARQRYLPRRQFVQVT